MIFGYHYEYIDRTEYGFDAFIQPLYDVWDFIISSPILLILFAIMVIYQIWYFLHKEGKKEKKKSKLQLKKILLYLSILCWILYFGISIYNSIAGICMGLFTCTTVYGFEAFYSSLFWYGLVFSFIPVLPVTLIYIILYIIKVKRKK